MSAIPRTPEVSDGAAPPALVETRDLVMHFPLPGGLVDRLRGRPAEVVRAVDGVSLAIAPGETVGLVGESGCGKTTFGRCLVRLYEPTGGDLRFRGESVLGQDAEAVRRLRRSIQMIFQDPYSSLNPRKTVRAALAEVLRVHRICPKAEVPARVAGLLERVGLSAALADRYPRQFSGGQRQRIGIARALAMEPAFIVADEAVSALDVSIQAQVLNLLAQLQDDLGLTYLFIAHNLGVVRHIADRVAVMYLGKIVEVQAAVTVFDQPLHPYTQALVRAIPTLDRGRAARPTTAAIEGDPPSPMAVPPGCRFHPRCPYVMPVCREVEPVLAPQPGGPAVACHLYPGQPANNSSRSIATPGRDAGSTMPPVSTTSA
ncbi:MAG: ATP-binding cassette domain-containing protein [Chloroflexia bacterium]|nr:ATP-binding cassette domain-containing protein [Chloroflexia bacterium]